MCPAFSCLLLLQQVRGLGRVPKFVFGYPNAMLAKPSASRLGAFGPLFLPSWWEKAGEKVNHAMIHFPGLSLVM